jgi:hypothetical protein
MTHGGAALGGKDQTTPFDDGTGDLEMFAVVIQTRPFEMFVLMEIRPASAEQQQGELASSRSLCPG